MLRCWPHHEFPLPPPFTQHSPCGAIQVKRSHLGPKNVAPLRSSCIGTLTQRHSHACILFVLNAISVSLLSPFITGLDVCPEERRRRLSWTPTHTDRSRPNTNVGSQVCDKPLVCASRAITGRKEHTWPLLFTSWKPTRKPHVSLRCTH